MQKIHIAMMFNDNYSIPGGVAILSLLQNADKNYQYFLYILHNDISQLHQDKLHSIVLRFKNASLTFVDMNNQFDKFALKLDYPKEVLYKLCIPSIFPDIDKIIITDVDVVFPGDISKEYINFTGDEYFAGAKQTQEPNHPPFSLDIKDNNYHFIVGAGYMIYNLKQMRKDKIEEKCLQYLKENVKYAKLPDQDILCQVCYPKIKLLHPKNMVLIPWYLRDDYIFEFAYNSTEKEHQEAKEDPIQLHYVLYKGCVGKPWINPFCHKSEIWYYYLSQTPFFEENFRRNLHLNEKLIKHNKKKKTIKQRFQKLVKKLKRLF